MAKWRNPLTGVQASTIGLVALTSLWTGFQVFDPEPPPVLDQILVATFGIWFATEARRNSKSKEDDDE